MASRTGKRKKPNGKNASISEALVKGQSKILVEHGKSYPHVPGLVRSPIPLAPSAVRLVLEYGFATTISVAVGSLGLNVFTGNGLFDPDVTGVGGQPLGFDQWSTLFQRYRVLASSIDVAFNTPDATTNDAQVIKAVVVPSALATTFATYVAASSQPYAVEREMNGVIPTPTSRLKSMMETSVIMGSTKQGIMADDTLQASTGANPANLWYWHCYVTTIDTAANASVNVTGVVRYLVDFFDRNLLTMSSLLEIRGQKRKEKWSSKTPPKAPGGGIWDSLCKCNTACDCAKIRASRKSILGKSD